jgi:hypothetical protein
MKTIVPVLKGTIDLSEIKPFSAKPDDKGNTVVKMAIIGSERINGEFSYPVYLCNALVGSVESENLGVIPDYTKVVISLFTNKISNKFITKKQMEIDVIISGRASKVYQRVTHPDSYTETYEIGEIAVEVLEDFREKAIEEETADYIDKSLPYSRFV